MNPLHFRFGTGFLPIFEPLAVGRLCPFIVKIDFGGVGWLSILSPIASPGPEHNPTSPSVRYARPRFPDPIQGTPNAANAISQQTMPYSIRGLVRLGVARPYGVACQSNSGAYAAFCHRAPKI